MLKKHLSKVKEKNYLAFLSFSSKYYYFKINRHINYCYSKKNKCFKEKYQLFSNVALNYANVKTEIVHNI